MELPRAKIACGLSALLVLAAGVWALHELNFVRHAAVTKATITNLIERHLHDGSTAYAPVYVFTDQKGESVKIVSWMASFPPVGQVGDTLEVLYDPGNPRHSIQNSFAGVWGLPVSLAGLGAFDFVVFGAVAFFTGRRLKAKSEQATGLRSQTA